MRRPTAIAHRGASAYAPENTLTALRQAAELRADLVEVDVQRTRDGALVLAHDADLARTTDAEDVLPHRAPWRIADLTLAEIEELDAGSWFSPAYAGKTVPTLEQALDVLADSGTGLQLEVKNPALYPGIAADVADVLLSRLPWVSRAVAAGRLVVQSFDHGVMRNFAGLGTGIPIGLLGHPPVRRLPALAEWAAQVNPRHRRTDAPYVDAIHAAGLECLVWTVDRPADMVRLLDLGVDGVISNRPDVLRRVMSDRLVPA